MSDQDKRDYREQEADSRVDAIAAFSLIMIAVAAVLWYVSHQ